MFSSPLIAAPMAGGTTTSELALAVQNAGAFAFAAGGYKTAEQLADHIAPLRTTGVDFGVNLFVPETTPLNDTAWLALARYREELKPTAELYGVELPELSRGNTDPRMQDFWTEKLDLLLSDPVPVVSFTFGLAPSATVQKLQKAGSRVVASVTSVAEALAAVETGVDALMVQHEHAGGHSAAFLKRSPAPRISHETLPQLLSSILSAVSIPLIGAGGVSSPSQAIKALSAGAVAVAIGTALIRSDESGARPLHKNALADPTFTGTAMTRAFTGKPARALINSFVTTHSSNAPEAYPHVHFLTAALRGAAAAAHDPQAINLWAGTGWKSATDGPAAAVVARFRNAF